MTTLFENFLAGTQRIGPGEFRSPRNNFALPALKIDGPIHQQNGRSRFASSTPTALELFRYGEGGFQGCMIFFGTVGSGMQGFSPTTRTSVDGTGLWFGLRTAIPGQRSVTVSKNGSADVEGNQLIIIGETGTTLVQGPFTVKNGSILFHSTTDKHAFATHLLAPASNLSAETSFPVGAIVAAKSSSSINRQAPVTVYTSSVSGAEYTLDAASGLAALSGTWRSRGRISADTFLMQRTA